ncbi:MAG TPA: GNAT family N-acetyltransferase [Fibrobacteraceae bacterium]|nr:GNAT family N-acetyltransferase [Fibrobacteraceae bacterium]
MTPVVTDSQIHRFRAGEEEALARLMLDWGDDLVSPSPEVLTRNIVQIRRVGGDLFVIPSSSREALIAYAQVGDHSMVGLDVAMELVALLVAREYRGQGLGSLLIDYAASWGVQHGYGVMTLSSQMHRVNAHRLYRRLGFSEFKQSIFFSQRSLFLILMTALYTRRSSVRPMCIPFVLNRLRLCHLAGCGPLCGNHVKHERTDQEG